MIRRQLHSIGSGYRLIFPAVLVFFLLLLSVSYIPVPGLSSFVPLFVAASVYYWAIFAPAALPRWFVFIAGIIQDLLYGTPVGSTSLALLLLWTLIAAQRTYLLKEPFMVIWFLFAVSLFLYCVVISILYMVLLGVGYFTASALMQYGITVVLYPLLHRLFGSLHSELFKGHHA